MNTMPQNPYIGPRTFQRNEGHLFFGRDREARDLIALVASERLVVFYAQSGAGKSSIVNTRLIPNLEEKEYEVLPVGRVSGEISTGTEVDNIYIYNLVRSLEQHDTDPASLSKLSLTEFLAHLNYDDQGFFYDPSPVESIPDEDVSMIIRRALIIDQFEELFGTHPEAWEKREDFFQQLAQAMRDDPQLWVVLVMREDFIAALDPYAHLVANGLRVRYYMQRLGREAALDAVKGPVKDLRPYAEGVAEELIDDLCSIKVQKPDGTLADQPGQYVEPVQLQVVCYGLWDNLGWDNFNPEETQITDRDLQDVGDVNQSLGKYYDKRVAEVAIAKNVRERSIREWFEKKLITPDGFRNMVMQQHEHKSGELDDDVIQALQSDLVRAEKRGGATWYELTHDRLVEPILERNKVWFNENLSPLQRQAALWNEQGRNETWLFSAQALVQAQDWANEHQDELTQIEKEFLKECQTKQKEKEQQQQARQARQRRIIANVSIVTSILFFGLFVYGVQQTLRANKNAEIANTNAEIAKANLSVAQTAQVDASNKAATAQFNAEEAEKQTSIARAGELAAQSQQLITEDFQTSLLLGIGSFRKFDTFQTRNALLGATNANPYLLQFLTGHTDYVSSVAFSPDGKTLASGSFDNTIILWDVAKRQPIGQPLTGHTDYVSSVAFSPDGKTLASGSADNTIILWDVSDPSVPSQLTKLTGSSPVYSVAFSPDGKTLASGSFDNTIILWDVAKRELIGQPLTGHVGYVSSVAFSPDGRILASGSFDNTIILWDVAKRQPIGQPLTGHKKDVSSVAFSPDGRILASGSADNTLILWDIATQQQLGQPLTGHKKDVSSVAFSPDGGILASGGADNTIILWELSDPSVPLQLTALVGHTDSVNSLIFSPDGKTLASGSADSTIVLWSVSDPSASSQLNKLLGPSSVYSSAFSPDGRTLASAGADKTITLWNVSNPLVPSQLGKLLESSPVYSVAFSPDGKTLASGGADNTIILWDVAKRQPIGQPLTGHADAVSSVAFSPDGQTLASGSADNTIILWDVATQQPIGQPLTGHNDFVYSVAFSPDGKTLASGGADNTIILWNVSNLVAPSQLSKLMGSSPVFSVAFSPDGKTLASGSADNTINLWNVTNKKPIGQPLAGHTNVVDSVAFSPDGETLASGSDDSTIILWDIATQQQIGQSFRGHIAPVYSVTFSPNGKTLVSGSLDNTIILWGVDPQLWIKSTCQRVGRNFTRYEWTQYFRHESYPTKQEDAACPQWPLEPEPTATTTPTEIQVGTATATPTMTPLAVPATATMAPSTIIATPTPVLYHVVNVTDTDRLNVRSGPGIKYAVIGKIPMDGTGIQVTGGGVQADNAIWVPIVYKDISGWVNSYYIEPEK